MKKKSVFLEDTAKYQKCFLMDYKIFFQKFYFMGKKKNG